MTECQASRVSFDHNPTARQLLRPFGQSGNRHDQLRIDRLTGNCRGGDGITCLVGQAGCPEQYRIANAVRKRHILSRRQLKPRWTSNEAPAGRESRAELAYIEGNTVGPVVHRSAQRRRDPAECLFQKSCAGLGFERLNG